MREHAAPALATMGPEAASARATLMKAIEASTSPSECLAEARALAVVGTDSKEAIPLLRKQSEKFPRVTGFAQAIEEICRTIESSK